LKAAVSVEAQETQFEIYILTTIFHAAIDYSALLEN
jgi:hypothetical protein